MADRPFGCVLDRPMHRFAHTTHLYLGGAPADVAGADGRGCQPAEVHVCKGRLCRARFPLRLALARACFIVVSVVVAVVVVGGVGQLCGWCVVWASINYLEPHRFCGEFIHVPGLRRYWRAMQSKPAPRSSPPAAWPVLWMFSVEWIRTDGCTYTAPNPIRTKRSTPAHPIPSVCPRTWRPPPALR